jgi:hypothetical protein
MAEGRIKAVGVTDTLLASVRWYAESEFEKKGLVSLIKRKSINIKSAKDGYYHGAHYCPECGKIFTEFSTK